MLKGDEIYVCCLQDGWHGLKIAIIVELIFEQMVNCKVQSKRWPKWGGNFLYCIKPKTTLTSSKVFDPSSADFHILVTSNLHGSYSNITQLFFYC